MGTHSKSLIILIQVSESCCFFSLIHFIEIFAWVFTNTSGYDEVALRVLHIWANIPERKYKTIYWKASQMIASKMMKECERTNSDWIWYILPFIPWKNLFLQPDLHRDTCAFIGLIQITKETESPAEWTYVSFISLDWYIIMLWKFNQWRLKQIFWAHIYN